MKKVLSIVAALFVFSYLLASKMDWFTELARSSVARNPIFSETINLKKRDTLVWEVKTNRIITGNGQAHLSLVLNELLLTEIPYDRTQIELKAKVSAYGNKPGGEPQNRLIINKDYVTDEPFKKDSGFWTNYGVGRLEFGLAAIDVRASEVLRIELCITIPDPNLGSGNPRLKIVGYYDPAARPWEFLFQDIVVNWGFYISLILLIGLFLIAWGRKNPTGKAGAGEGTKPAALDRGAFLEMKKQ